MPQDVVVVSDPQAFDDTIAGQIQKVGEKHPIFVYVIGKRDEEGKSWCPDCVKSDPIVHDALTKVHNYTLVECPVIRADYKGNPSFPYRTHAQLQIKGVPTFIHWTKDGAQKRLVEEELFTADPIATFLNPFH